MKWVLYSNFISLLQVQDTWRQVERYKAPLFGLTASWSGHQRHMCQAQHAVDIRQIQKQQPRKAGDRGQTLESTTKIPFVSLHVSRSSVILRKTSRGSSHAIGLAFQSGCFSEDFRGFLSPVFPRLQPYCDTNNQKRVENYSVPPTSGLRWIYFFSWSHHRHRSWKRWPLSSQRKEPCRKIGNLWPLLGSFLVESQMNAFVRKVYVYYILFTVLYSGPCRQSCDSNWGDFASRVNSDWAATAQFQHSLQAWTDHAFVVTSAYCQHVYLRGPIQQSLQGAHRKPSARWGSPQMQKWWADSCARKIVKQADYVQWLQWPSFWRSKPFPTFLLRVRCSNLTHGAAATTAATGWRSANQFSSTKWGWSGTRYWPGTWIQFLTSSSTIVQCSA